MVAVPEAWEEPVEQEQLEASVAQAFPGSTQTWDAVVQEEMVEQAAQAVQAELEQPEQTFQYMNIREAF